MLTNNVVSFEQPGPGLSGNLLSTVASCGGFLGNLVLWVQELSLLAQIDYTIQMAINCSLKYPFISFTERLSVPTEKVGTIDSD